MGFIGYYSRPFDSRVLLTYQTSLVSTKYSYYVYRDHVRALVKLLCNVVASAVDHVLRHSAVAVPVSFWYVCVRPCRRSMGQMYRGDYPCRFTWKTRNHHANQPNSAQLLAASSHLLTYLRWKHQSIWNSPPAPWKIHNFFAQLYQSVQLSRA